jgi:hypothetical protein
MLGIILTLVAVLLVICFAFCYTEQEHPSGRGARADALFFAARKSRQGSDNVKQQDSRIL